MSNNGDRPAKRQRTDLDPPQPEVKHETPGLVSYTHHAELWFDDGNLVVVSNGEDTQTAFKIYQGIVTKHSPKLTELVAAIDDSSRYIGSPILLLDDSASYVEGMLRWLFCRSLGTRCAPGCMIAWRTTSDHTLVWLNRSSS
jgi:hypothetical protein